MSEFWHRLGQATARPGLLPGHGDQRDEAAVAAAVRRGRRTPHPGQPDPGAARGRRRSDRRVERLWATPSQVLAVADNIARLPTAGAGAELLVVTAAWTGARWGEIAGLQRRNTHLDDGVIVIDPLIGAMIESSRGIELGPPKTAESARAITLPRS